MKLSEIKQALSENSLRLTKSLGQNFLHDGNQLRRILRAAELSRTDRVLEIGPGLGPLTELLLPQAAEVLAIETDRRLVGFLQRRFATAATLTLRHDDALEFLRREPRDWSDWKVVANLPYSVASPMLVELSQAPRPPRLMAVTLQFEVVQRLLATPGSEDYGLLTLLVHLNFEPRGHFRIPASCFFPEPDVDSACVTLVRREQRLLPIELAETFVRVVKQGFAQRRKVLLKLLKEHWRADIVSSAFARAELAPGVRAEAVSLEQFVRLTQALAR